MTEKITEVGALERYFRPEGKFKDGTAALPVTKSRLRLYCLRLSDKILILGNGGIKASQTYNEDTSLAGYVMTLQKFEELLNRERTNGNVTITERHVESKVIFKL